MCHLPFSPRQCACRLVESGDLASPDAQMMSASSSRVSMCLLMNSKDEKKMALTAHDLTIETPRPRYMRRLKNSILGGGSTSWPLEYMSEFRWYTLLAESIGSVGKGQPAPLQRVWSSKNLQMRAQEAMPQRPPAIMTATGFEFGSSPPNVVPSCLPLS